MRASVSGVASGRGDGSRPSSQNTRDRLVVEAQSMPLAGKILHIRVCHVTVGTPSSTPLAGALSSLRATTPDAGTTATSSGGASQSLGFRVLAIDELDNEFSLFVSRQKAEYLFRAQCPAKSASMENASALAAPSLEAMANSVIDQLDIIGNRHRDIGKLICREPEVHVAKRTRAMPARDAASKQKNPHLLAKNDQRAVRAKKTVLRTMEAIATAQQQDNAAAFDQASVMGEVSPRSRRSRKSSDESLLHRMAFSNDKPVWRSDLETNYEEQQQFSAASAAPFSLTPNVTLEAATAVSAMTPSRSATAVGPSAPRRVIPERKHKHKDLYERREKERKQRLLVTRAKSSSYILESESVVASSPFVLERPGEEDELPKALPDPRAIRARFNAAVRNAYAVRTFLGAKSFHETEQFLRRRTVDHTERCVFKGNDPFGGFPGMRVEITHEQPEFRGGIDEDDPMLQKKLRILTQAARRSSFVRDKDGNLIRRPNSSRGGSSRRPNSFGVEPLVPLVASSSAPVLGTVVDMDLGINSHNAESEYDQGRVRESLHDDKNQQVSARKHEERPTEIQALADSTASCAKKKITVEKKATDESSVDASTTASPRTASAEKPADMKVRKDGDKAAEAISTADPEIVYEPAANSAGAAAIDPAQGALDQEHGQPLLPPADQGTASPATSLPVQTEAYEAAVQDIAASATPRRCLSPVVTSRRQTCWDDKDAVESEVRSPRHDPEPAELQREPNCLGDEASTATDDQSLRQLRPRPKSAGDAILARSDLRHTEEMSVSPPNPTADGNPVGEGSEDEVPLPDPPVGVQLSNLIIGDQESTVTADLPPRFLSARKSRRQFLVDSTSPDVPTLGPSVDTVAACETSSPVISSEFANTLESPMLALQFAEEPASSAHLGEKAEPLGDMHYNLTATQTDEETPRSDVMQESSDHFAGSPLELVDTVVDCSVIHSTNGSEVAPVAEAETKQVGCEDVAPSRNGGNARTHHESVSDEQVSAIAAAASAAVVAAAAQTSSKSNSPVSSSRPHAVETRSSNPKSPSKTYSASPNSSQRGGPMLPRDSLRPPSKRRSSVIRQQPGQALTEAKPVSHCKSVANGAFPTPPDLPGPGAHASVGMGLEATNSSESSGGSHNDAHQSSGGSDPKPSKSKRRRSVTKSLALVPSSYHKTWSKWVNERSIVEKISCLQLEEQVLADQQNEGTLVKLGLRYARWSGTSLAAILLLEHAAVLHESAPRTHEFWNSMSNAHLDIFLRNRKFLPAASFHLERCVKSLTRALAFMESMADPLLLLRFALCLFWHPEHGHLERADEIFRQLFAKFASFCDKDRANLLFLHFQVLHRLKIFADACECIDKIIVLVSSTETADTKPTPQPRPSSMDDEASTSPPAYELADYCMMKMQCQQASGDYMLATSTFSRVLGAKGFVQDGSLADDQYLELWLSVAEKCFYFEDYALAIEYYAIALNFAKESQLLAAVHYKLGLCFQALGDNQRCVAEYKRARNMNRHVRPPVSLTELRGCYDDQFASLLEKSVRQVIEEVRVNLYDRAVRQLQLVFRRKHQAPTSRAPASDGATGEKMPSIVPRKLSRPLSRARPVSGSPQLLDNAITASLSGTSEGTATDATLASESGVTLDEAEVDAAARRQAEFEARKKAALGLMKKLQSAPSSDVHPPGLVSRSTHVIRATTQSELLSPERHRPEVRRLRSMATFNHLGYLPSTAPCVEHWEKLLALATDLFPTRRSVARATCAVRAVLPRVSDEIAFCALADALGEMNSAVERLRNSSYERELSFVCSVIDVERMLEQALSVRLPSISSPSRPPESPPVRLSIDVGRFAAAKSPLASLLSPSKRSRPSSPQASPRPVRLEQMLETQFQQHLQAKAQSLANELANATQELNETQLRHEKVVILRDFRQVNTTLLPSQLPFGSEKPRS